MQFVDYIDKIKPVMDKKLKNKPHETAEDSAVEKFRFRGLDMPLNAVVFLAIATLFIYMGTLRAPFVFDDMHAIVKNPYITNLNDVKGFFLTTPDESVAKIEHSGWRPLWYLSFALNYHFSKLQPAMYHATNIFIHFLNVLMVYFLAMRLMRGRSNKPWLAALLAGLFFAAHPLQTETVSYVSSRSTSMAALFYLLAFYAYDVYRDRGWRLLLAVTALSFCMAAMTKENVITLPAMIIAYDFSLKDKSRRPYMGFALIVLLTAVYTAFRFYIGSKALAMALPRSPVVFWITEVFVMAMYILKVFLPTRLNIDPDMDELTGIADPRFYLSLAAILLVLYGVYRLYKKDRFAGFFLLWFFVAIMPETVLPLADLMAEHRTYLPLAGPALLFGYYMERLSTRAPAKSGRDITRYLGYAAAISLLFLFAVGTMERNKAYQSNMALWTDTVEKSPGKYRPLMALGVIYSDAGKLEMADEYLKKALAIEPDSPYIHYNMNLNYRKMKRYDEALKQNLAALQQLPDDDTFLTGLGTLYSTMGQPGKAEEVLRKVIARKPDYPPPHYNLGSIYLKQGRTEEAVNELKTAIGLSPHLIEPRNDLGTAYLRLGKYDLALEQYREAARLNPADLFTLHNLAVALQKAGDKKGAVEQYRVYLSLAPKDSPDRESIKMEIEKISK